jgi:hypothetical protein
VPVAGKEKYFYLDYPGKLPEISIIEKKMNQEPVFIDEWEIS